MGNTLAGGLLGLAVAAGIGCGLTRLLGGIPARWRLTLALLAGVAVIDWVVMLALFLGGGVFAIKVIGAGSAVVGFYLLWACRKRLAIVPGLKPVFRPDRWFIAVIIAACAINLLIALAPSTKIDELHYHMLIPKRVMQDDGLYLYRLPYEAAIFPQTAYQLGLVTEHAAGFPESGNVLSWGLGVALILLVAGVTTDLTGSTTAGWMTAAVATVGLYPAVWHVTSGPHAFGDLATVTGALLALLPENGTVKLKPQARLVLICLAAYAAASTKISNLPVAAAVTVLGAYRVSPALGWKKAVSLAAAIWSILYGPVIAWTTWKCGSPLGLATAAAVHSHYFGTDAIAMIRDARAVGQTGLLNVVRWLIPSVSLAMIAAFGVVAAAAWRRERMSLVVSGLVLGQVLLIAWLLPHEFRFLGGLQYLVLIAGAAAFWRSASGKWAIARWWLVLGLACLPWLGVQIYYAGPFLSVDSGRVSRDSFRDRYVAFSRDFRALDRLLPSRAVLYAIDRIPAYYAPRRVIFTLDDRHQTGPLYRFRVGDDSPPLPSGVACTETVYENPEAVSEVYRTPGRAPEHERLKIERCDFPLAPTR